MKHSITPMRLIGLCLLLWTGFVVPGCGSGNTNTSNTVLTPSGATVYSTDGSVSMTFPPNVVTVSTKVDIVSGAHAANLGNLNPTGLPAYKVQLTDKTSASRAAVDLNSFITVKANLPAGADASRGEIYIARPDQSGADVVDSFFDTKTHKITARIPIQLFNQNVTRAPGGREEPPVGFTVIRELTIGVTVLDPTPNVSGPAQITKMTYTGGSWVNDDWVGVRNVGTEHLSGKRIAVVVHGTWSNLAELPELPNYLANLTDKSDSSRPFFDAIIGINYDSLRAGPDLTGDLLGQALAPLAQNKARLFLFAHSQGGLVSRWAIERGGAKDAVMLVMFGTPNDGIPSAAVWAAAKGKKTPPDSPALVAMKYNVISGTRSTFLQALNQTGAPGNAAYYTITGDTDFFSADGIEAYTHLFLIGGADDGVVYLDSARLQRLHGFTAYDRGTYSDARNVTIPVQHTRLHLVGTSASAVAETLKGWIYQEGLGDANVSIN